MRVPFSLIVFVTIPLAAMAQHHRTGENTAKTSTTPSNWYSGAPDFSSNYIVLTNEVFGTGYRGDMTKFYKPTPLQNSSHQPAIYRCRGQQVNCIRGRDGRGCDRGCGNRARIFYLSSG